MDTEIKRLMELCQLPEEMSLQTIKLLLSHLPNLMGYLTEQLKVTEEELMLARALVERTKDNVIVELMEQSLPKWRLDLEARSHPSNRKAEAQLEKTKLKLKRLLLDMDVAKAKLDAVKKVANLEANDVFGQLRSEAVSRGSSRPASQRYGQG